MSTAGNKTIQRETSTSSRIFDDRSLSVDYRTLAPLLRSGLHVLDVGCGTGAITKDIAAIVYPGTVIGIDNTLGFIESGRQQYAHVPNLSLVHADLFTFRADAPFDLIVSARTMQWLSHVPEAVSRMASMLRPGGTLSVLDYNHTKVEWIPGPPASMRKFYNAFLRWREAAGMNNRIGDELEPVFAQAGLEAIETFEANEHHQRGEENFPFRASIWKKVAGLRQIVDEGFVSEEDRVRAVDEYSSWIENQGTSMTLKLRETRGQKSLSAPSPIQ